MTTISPSALPPAIDVPDVEVPDVDRRSLLAIARAAIAAATGRRSRSLPEAEAESAELLARRGGAFVTLTEGGELRGCIGLVEPRRRLVESVAIAAVGAAMRDPRFDPLAESELANTEVEVSVLGPAVRLEDPRAFRPGTDGLIVRSGRHTGLLLPEVALDHGLDVVGMLEAACDKAGLARTAWREHGTTVQAFRTCRFGGPAAA